MPTTLGSRQNFQMWKWRALHKRRLFFFSLLQLILICEWFSVFRNWNGSYDFNNDNSSYMEDFSTLSGVMVLIHLVLMLSVIVSNSVRSKLNESQGMRFCEASMVSLLVVAYFLVRPYEFNDDDITCDSDSFALLSVFGLSACQYLGLNETDTGLTRLSILGLWILYFSTRRCEITAVASIILNLFAVLCASSLQEHEFLRTFAKQKDGGASSTTKTHGGGSSGTLVADMCHALRSMELTVGQHLAVLEREGLCRLVSKCDNSLLTGDENGVEEGWLMSRATWEWSYQAASLRENAMMCQALFFATADKTEHPPENTSDFSFGRVCHELFGLFEGVCGVALPLHVSEAGGPVYIRGQRTAFELLLFLLVQDCVRTHPRGILFISCDRVGDVWRIRLQVTATETERRQRSSLQFEGTERPTARNPAAGLIGDLPALSGGKTLPKLITESLTVGRGLLLDENAWDQVSCMDRLAERISHSYFDSLLDVDDPQFSSGLRITRKMLKMPPGMCSSSPHRSGPREADWGDQTLAAATRLDGSGVELVCDVHHEWVFVSDRTTQHQQSSSGDVDSDFAEIRDKMRTINLPHSLLPVTELVTTSRRFSVLVVHETYLLRLSEESPSLVAILQRAALSLVVVWAGAVGSVHDLRIRCGVEVAAGLLSKATLQEVFGQIKAITGLQRPRRFFDCRTEEGDSPTSPNNRSGVVDGVLSEARESATLKADAETLSSVRPRRSSKSGPQQYLSMEHDRSHERSVARWSVLVRQFSQMAGVLYPASAMFAASQLRGRLSIIEGLPKEDRLSFAGSLGDEQHGEMAVYKSLGPQKRKAKFILSVYEPILEELRSLFEASNLLQMKTVSSAISIRFTPETYVDMLVECFTHRSCTLGLLQLSCWFNTLQEVISLVETLAEKDSSRDAATVVALPIVPIMSSSKRSESALLSDELVVEDITEVAGAFEECSSDMTASGSIDRSSGMSTARSAPTIGAPSNIPVDRQLREVVGDMLVALEVSVWDAALDR